jgi:integrase
MTLEKFSRQEPIVEKPKILRNWLELNYSKQKTRRNSSAALTNFLRFIYGKDAIRKYERSNFGSIVSSERKVGDAQKNDLEIAVSQYLDEIEKGRDFLLDVKKFISFAIDSGYSPGFINVEFVKIRVFFKAMSPKCLISSDDLKGMKGLLPKNKAVTQDDILTKEQTKIVLDHLSLHGRAIALFLMSTGARIGETCQLKMSDINLEADPPEVNIRNEYTKGGIGGRVMWFSYEARDVIREWHKERLTKRKHGPDHAYFDKVSVFNIDEPGLQRMWNISLRRADGNCVPPILAKRDPSSKMRIHVYHVHTLRKFFITNMQLGGVPDIYWQTWVAHTGYLGGSYSRPSNATLREVYKKYMPLVTIQELSSGQKDTEERDRAKMELAKVKQETEDIIRKLNTEQDFIEILSQQLSLPETMTLDNKKAEILRRIILFQALEDRKP